MVSQRASDGLWLRLDNIPNQWRNNPKITVRVELPHALAVHVDLKVGEAEVRDMNSDVEIEVGVGDAELTMAQEFVHSAHVKAGVGDATLKHGGQYEDGDGIVGKEVLWDEGRGVARLRVKVGVGDANVRLR
jgi:hypothetical protein